MVSLWQVQDIIGQADHLENIGVELPGIGGEIARGDLSEPEFYILGQRKESMQRSPIQDNENTEPWIDSKASIRAHLAIL